ncbi:MAG: class I SAM-dependent methyltransferase, partial [Candidatus Binatia bacterium]
MNPEQIKRRRQEVVKQFGDWTAHNIHLKDDLYTYVQDHPRYNDRIIQDGIHLRRIVQIVADIVNQPLRSLRVLDLACLEGLYGIEFARHGATVVGMEGREANIEKARFAKDALSLDNIMLVHDDVRRLNVEKYGRFDVVLCLGILYHLDAPDVFHFLEGMSEICQRLAIIDTQIGIKADRSYIFRGLRYDGWSYTEHKPESSMDERLTRPWASLDNEKSFWFTRPSLFNVLADVGFTSVYTCHNPAVPGQLSDRDTLVAIKGQRQELFSTPTVNSL